MFLGLEVDEIFGIEETSGVSPVVGPSHLTGCYSHLRKRSEQDSRLVGEPDAFAWSGAGCKRATHPNNAFIKVWQKLRADHATYEQKHRCADHD